MTQLDTEKIIKENIVPTFGILQPLMANQWKATYKIDHQFTKEAEELLSNQTTSIDIDYVNKLYKIKIEHPIYQYPQEFIDLIKHLCENGFIFKLEALNTDGNSITEIFKGRLYVEKHECSFDFSLQEILTHTLYCISGSHV